MKVRIRESVLRNIIQEEVINMLNEGLFNRKPQNMVIEIGKQYGWNLVKQDGNTESLEGSYVANAISSYSANIPDTASFPQMIAGLRQSLREYGLTANASNFHKGMEGLKPGVENPNGGMPSMFGTITVSRV